jgi:signal transduction histidine kinase
MDRTAWNDTQEEGLRLVVPLLAGLSVVCAIASAPGTAAQNVVAALAAVPFFLWAFAWRRMPALLLMALTCAAAGFSLETGQLEPLLFLVCVAANVVGGWEPSTRALVAGTVLACATPVLIEVFHDDDILYGVWIMGITLSLLLPRTFRWQLSLVTQLAEAREELAHQAVLEEKRAIARDVHDLVGHGLAAVMLHVTGARHVAARPGPVRIRAIRVS